MISDAGGQKWEFENLELATLSKQWVFGEFGIISIIFKINFYLSEHKKIPKLSKSHFFNDVSLVNFDIYNFLLSFVGFTPF